MCWVSPPSRLTTYQVSTGAEALPEGQQTGVCSYSGWNALLYPNTLASLRTATGHLPTSAIAFIL